MLLSRIPQLAERKSLSLVVLVGVVVLVVGSQLLESRKLQSRILRPGECSYSRYSLAEVVEEEYPEDWHA
jgi:hypothetical protein